ncbi:NlpC/P60 family protein [Kitasatospora sp. NPDC056138]|uniref:C40 family peptidase n=1 Tax=Kitasatospora sp. NPDC056138 TaxID=3345724 RepID=UPI0035E2B389
MASHRRPKPASRTRVTILTAAAATAVALSAQTGAHADPKPTKDEVATQVDQLDGQAEAATEKFNAATEKQQTLQKQVSDLQDQVARQQDRVSTVQQGLAEIAAEQYRNGGISPTVQLMLSSSPDSFLSRADSIQQVGLSQADALKTLKGEQEKLDQQKAEAQQKLAELDATTKDLKTSKDEVQAKLAQAKALLDTLTQQEREALQAAQDKAAADAAASARASRDSSRADLSSGGSGGSGGSGSSSKSGGSRAGGSVNVPSGSYAAAAVAAAESQEGKPYLWGATGPDAFDCSGLMQWAYAKAGVSLPRTSQEQASAGTNMGTDISNARPGDLIIFYDDQHHVGMYVGGGQVIHAPRAGKPVQYMSATVLPISAIVRV